MGARGEVKGRREERFEGRYGFWRGFVDEEVRAISKTRLAEQWGAVGRATLRRLERALLIAMDLPGLHDLRRMWGSRPVSTDGGSGLAVGRALHFRHQGEAVALERGLQGGTSDAD